MACDLCCDQVFSDNPAFAGGLTQMVRRHCPADQALRILEIGCGTGGQIAALLPMLPNASFTGIDLSPANIEQAAQRCRRAVEQGRVTLQAGDYMQCDIEPVDLIVADTALHLIGTAPPKAVFARIACQLAPGGLLIATIPNGCLFNHLLWSVRRGARAIRCDVIDSVILAVASRVYRGRYDEAFLRQRLPYMYSLPQCHDGRGVRRLAQSCGLELVDAEPAPHVSIAQPYHNVVVFVRKESHVAGA